MINRAKIRRIMDGSHVDRFVVDVLIMESLSKQRSFAGYSNEFIFKVASYGKNKHALPALYENTKKLWLRTMPVSKSQLHLADDWAQIAAFEFAKKWHKYDPDYGFKFNTFIVRVITNSWRNELRKEIADFRMTEVNKTYASEFKDFSNLLITQYSAYDDLEYFNTYMKRFGAYLIDEVPKTIFDVFFLRSYFGSDFSVKQLAHRLKQKVFFVEKALRIIEIHARNFGQIEKDLKYGICS